MFLVRFYFAWHKRVTASYQVPPAGWVWADVTQCPCAKFSLSMLIMLSNWTWIWQNLFKNSATQVRNIDFQGVSGRVLWVNCYLNISVHDCIRLGSINCEPCTKVNKGNANDKHKQIVQGATLSMYSSWGTRRCASRDLANQSALFEQ